MDRGGEARVKRCLCLGDGKECPLYTHNGTKALIRHLRKDLRAEWKFVLAASSKSGQQESERRDACKVAHNISWAAARASQ